jgi:hypothetical protein
MKETIVRIRIHPVLFKKYKIICVEKDLSLPKLTEQLIRSFINADESNKKLMSHIKKDEENE